MNKLRITNEYIASLGPCKDRYENYLLHYKDTDLSISEFLQLDNITYEDKIWVWKKFATKNEAVKFGLKCAQSVLNIFEDRYPEDKRPRLALEAVDNYLQNPTEENKRKCKNAAYAAAAAAYAAAYAAYAAEYAYAAAYAAYAYAAAYAAYAAEYAAYAAEYAAMSAQKELNLKYLIEIYKDAEG
jgi:hypothetical protein